MITPPRPASLTLAGRGSTSPALTSVGAARRALAQAFRAAGLDSPAVDARLLIAYALGLDHAGLAAASERPLTHEEGARIDTLAARRLAREPVARILGVKEFWGLPLRLTPAVLVPRPESETVVEASLAALGGVEARGRALRIADLGTGSGALLLALLTELPNACGVGTDRDPLAATAARENAERLALANRARFVVCDYGAALAGGFDLVVSNPPYVRTHDIAGLAPEVRSHDPRLALDGGPDGLDAYRAIVGGICDLLRIGGRLVVEVGAGQSQPVEQLLADTGLSVERDGRRDLSGTIRAVVAKRVAWRLSA
jgi:release factor glutamine methyltransferase